MPREPPMDTSLQNNLYRQANVLAVVTIFYNLLEGGISMWLGAADETLTLFGFGVDSLIEVVSAVGIWHMLRRISTNNGVPRDEFEQRALKITAASFYLLSAGLAIGGVYSVYVHHKPETTLWGMVVSLISILVMWILIIQKTKVGKALGSEAMLADAACSRVCIYLSCVLLVASGAYELTGFGYLDGLGSLFIAWLAFREGREFQQKEKGGACGCCCTHSP